MKRIIMTISLVIVFASLFVFGVIFMGGQGNSGSIVSSVQAKDDEDDDNRGGCRTNCSLRSLKGCYGSTITGTLLPNPGPLAGPVAGVVLAKYDGRGGFTQIDTVTIGGVLIATGKELDRHLYSESGLHWHGNHQLPRPTPITINFCARRRRERDSSRRHNSWTGDHEYRQEAVEADSESLSQYHDFWRIASKL